MRRAAVLLPLVAVLSVVVGCGSDDSGTGPAEAVTTTVTSEAVEGPTKAEFIADADAVCKKFNAKIDGIRDQVNAAIGTDGTVQPGELSALSAALDEWADAAEAQASGLEQLPQPNEDKKALTRFTDLAREYVALTEAGAEEARVGNVGGISRLSTQIGDAYETLAAMAVGYGFKICGKA